MDSMTVAKANTKVEDTPIRTIIVGDAYLEQGKKGLPPHVSVFDWREGQSIAYLLYRQIIVVNAQASSLPLSYELNILVPIRLVHRHGFDANYRVGLSSWDKFPISAAHVAGLFVGRNSVPSNAADPLRPSR